MSTEHLHSNCRVHGFVGLWMTPQSRIPSPIPQGPIGSPLLLPILSSHHHYCLFLFKLEVFVIASSRAAIVTALAVYPDYGFPPHTFVYRLLLLLSICLYLQQTHATNYFTPIPDAYHHHYQEHDSNRSPRAQSPTIQRRDAITMRRARRARRCNSTHATRESASADNR